MTISDLHKRKLKKNLAVLALVLGWCALIWLVTMARMAHGAEIPPGGNFLTTRTAHQAQIDATKQQFVQDWQARDNDRTAANAARDSQRATHVAALDQTKVAWDKHWTDGDAKRQSDDATRDSQRTTHAQMLETRPSGWYQEWDKDYNHSVP